MTEKLNLTRATAKLASLLNDPSLADDPMGILYAGAEGRIPVYWRKPKFLSTKLSNFATDWNHTDSLADWLQIHPHDLHALAQTNHTDVLSFELSTEDIKTLKEIQEKFPSSVQYADAMDKATGQEKQVLLIGEPGFRHANYQPVTIQRDQLFVFESDLKVYAATLAPKKQKISKPPWWRVEINTLEWAQDIGEKLHEENEKKPNKDPDATSNREIAKKIESRIKDLEGKKAHPRAIPGYERIRRVILKDWKFKPK